MKGDATKGSTGQFKKLLLSRGLHGLACLLVEP